MRVLFIILAVMFATKANAMPWPCWKVRMFAGGMSEAEIWSYAKANKVRVTRKLERDVRECLKR